MSCKNVFKEIDVVKIYFMTLKETIGFEAILLAVLLAIISIRSDIPSVIFYSLLFILVFFIFRNIQIIEVTNEFFRHTINFD